MNNIEKHITLEERLLIEKHLNSGYSVNFIRRLLKRSYSGILKEVRRGGGSGNYTAEKGHQCYLDNLERVNIRPYLPITTELHSKILADRQYGMSIQGLCKKHGISYARMKNALFKETVTFKKPESTDLEARITAIELQLEILFDIIKQKESHGKNDQL